MIYNNVTELIGNTPLLRLKKFEKDNGLNFAIYAKLEFMNPAGSVKDRVAFAMIADAERKGNLTQGGTIIEPTSGNTGIAVAAVAVSLGYKAIIVMPENMSIERQQILKAYGAQVVLTSADEGMQGAINKAHEIANEIDGSIIAGQFTNKINPTIHKKTTGPEIWEDTNGEVDVFVSSVGTGGTLSGTGEYLKEKNPNIEVIAVEPEGSPFLSKGQAGKHKIQGIGAGFIPDTLNTKIYDRIITVTDEEAYSNSQNVASSEGVFVGISSGAVLSAIVKLSKEEKYKNKKIVCIFPDSGERYLSVPSFIK